MNTIFMSTCGEIYGKIMKLTGSHSTYWCLVTDDDIFYNLTFNQELFDMYSSGHNQYLVYGECEFESDGGMSLVIKEYKVIFEKELEILALKPKEEAVLYEEPPFLVAV